VPKYLADLHGNYAPSEGNHTISTSYLASSILATAGASQVLAGTPFNEPYHKVIRMAETFGLTGLTVRRSPHWRTTG
jgi:hypothetical protein